MAVALRFRLQASRPRRIVKFMNFAATIIVSAFAGILLLLLIAGIAALIFLHLKTQRSHAALIVALTANADTLGGIVEDSTSELNRMIEGAKASFTGIRQDLKVSNDALAKSLGKTLSAHESVFKEEMGKINATALHAASVRAFEACGQMVQVANTLQRLLVSHDVPEPGADLLPEEYAPSDTIYATQSPTARMDQGIEQAEAEESAPLYVGTI